MDDPVPPPKVEGQVEHLSGSEQRLWWVVCIRGGDDYDWTEEGFDNVVAGMKDQGGHENEWLERLF